MPTELTSLSLYHLDNELLQLLQYREERVTDQEAPADEEELTSLDGEIKKYLEALPRKVDKVAGVFRMWKGQKELIKAEADRLAKMAARIEGNETRLKAYVADVLEMQPMPAKGCKKLTGADGSVLMLKGNGGLQPLIITDEAAVPLDCKKATVVMPADEWAGMKEHFLDIGMTLISDRVETDNKAIREAIIDTGGIPGAHLEERGHSVIVK